MTVSIARVKTGSSLRRRPATYALTAWRLRSSQPAPQTRQGTARPARSLTRFIPCPSSSGSPNRSQGSKRRAFRTRAASTWPIQPFTPLSPASAIRTFPDLIDKVAVLTCHLAWNHPPPDGNKRASWACLVLFLDLNDVVWDLDPPDVDEGEAAILAVAAHDVDETWFADWLRRRTNPSQRRVTSARRRGAPNRTSEIVTETEEIIMLTPLAHPGPSQGVVGIASSATTEAPEVARERRPGPW